MPLKISIASGKGGTGKTTVSINLFHYLASGFTGKVQLVDCDVEEPNIHIFFPQATYQTLRIITRPVPIIDPTKCTFCRKCVEHCEFNAITVLPPVGFADVNPSLCHSCGACLVACQDGAIHEKTEEIGMIRQCILSENKILAEGRLHIGSTMQTSMIRELKRNATDSPDLILYDAPPGTSCPVVETVADADYVILVTEPTPFGLYDLRITVDLIRTLEKPFGIIVNKAGLGSLDLSDFLRKEHIEILGKIPFNREYAGQYAQGNLTESPDIITSAFKEIVAKLIQKINRNERDYGT